MSPQCLPPSFGSFQLTIWSRYGLKTFKMATTSWISDQNNSAILNLYVAPMPLIKFWLHPTYNLGDVIWRISRWPLWQPSWILEGNDFSNSESTCGPNASHQVSTQSDIAFGSRCGLSIFKMATRAAIIIYFLWPNSLCQMVKITEDWKFRQHWNRK